MILSLYGSATAIESFRIYPAYGASLQVYIKNDTVLIPHSLPDFLTANSAVPSKGYRSYTGVLGLRPIWAFGAHHNPCIIWNFPFEWNLKQTVDQIKIELRLNNYHVDVKYLVIVTRGEPGFIFKAEAVNKLDDVWGAWNFNLPLTLLPEDTAAMMLEWDGKKLNPFHEGNAFFVIPGTDAVTLRRKRIAFTIKADRERTSGYYTSWHTNLITPDLHGKYRKLNSGDTCSAIWEFRPARD